MAYIQLRMDHQEHQEYKPVLREAEGPDHDAALVIHHELAQHAAELEEAPHPQVHRLLQEEATAVLELLLEAVDVDENGRDEADLREVLDRVALDRVPRALLREPPEGGAETLHRHFHPAVVLSLHDMILYDITLYYVMLCCCKCFWTKTTSRSASRRRAERGPAI